MLTVEHLVKKYPNGTQALNDVSFQVQDGEFLAVIGLSGFLRGSWMYEAAAIALVWVAAHAALTNAATQKARAARPQPRPAEL